MKTILLSIDFINDIVCENGQLVKFGVAAHAKQRGAIENASRFLRNWRANSGEVLHVRVAFKAGHPELAGVKAPFYVAHREHNWLVDGTWGTEFHQDLTPAANEIALTKCRVNPFTNPELSRRLEGVDSLVVMGVSTNLAIEETVRTAAALGFTITLLEDCCASNNEEMHQFAVRHTFPKFSNIVSSTEFLRTLGNPA